MTVIENPAQDELPMPSSPASEAAALAAPPTPVLIIIGKTGVGKSSFIKLLDGKDLNTQASPPVSDGPESCTTRPTAYRAIVQQKPVILVDTPGFDDSARDDMELLREVVSHLYFTAIHGNVFPFHGIIFLHDISEIRYSGSQQKTFSMLRMICGKEGMGNVIVGTTMWNFTNPSKLNQQETREQFIHKKYWTGIDQICRLPECDYDAAGRIVMKLLAKPPVLLQAQKEMLEPPHTIEGTTVGKHLMTDGERELRQLQLELEEQKRKFEEEKARAEEEAEVREKERNIRYLEAIIAKFRDSAELSIYQKVGLNIGASLILGPQALFRLVSENVDALIELSRGLAIG